MPIIGLTDNSGGLHFPRIATLKKGAPKQPNRPGKDLDHFRVEFMAEYIDLAPIFSDLYGEAPRQLRNIRFTSDHVDEVFPTWLEQWNGAGTLLCRTDGATVVRWYDPVSNQYRNDSKPFKPEEYPETKQVGRLSFLLPDLVAETGVLGVVTLITSSYNDIRLIYDRLAMLRGMFGKLTGVPFVLGRVAREISVPMNGKRGRMEKNLIALDVDPAFTATVLLPHLTQQTALPPADHDDLLSLPPITDDVPETNIIPETTIIAGETTTSGCWYDDPQAQQKFADWLVTRNLAVADIQPLTGKHPREYPDGRTACQHIDEVLLYMEHDGWREAGPRQFFLEVEQAGLDFAYVLQHITDRPIKGPAELQGWTLTELRERLTELAQAKKSQHKTTQPMTDIPA